MSRPNLTPIYTGVSLMIWGLILTFLGIFMIVVAIAMAFDTILGALGNPAKAGGGAETALLLLRLGVYAIIVAQILNILGPLLCLGAPANMEGKGLIYTSVACQLPSLAINLAGNFTDIPQNVRTIGAILGIVAFITFIAFLGKVGEYIRNSDVSGRASGTLRAGIYTVATYALAFVAALAELGAVAVVFMLAALVMAIIFLVKYITLLTTTKAAVKFSSGGMGDDD